MEDVRQKIERRVKEEKKKKSLSDKVQEFIIKKVALLKRRYALLLVDTCKRMHCLIHCIYVSE